MESLAVNIEYQWGAENAKIIVILERQLIAITSK